MTDIDKARRMDRLREGYRTWHRNKYGIPDPCEEPKSLTAEELDQITKALELPIPLLAPPSTEQEAADK